MSRARPRAPYRLVSPARIAFALLGVMLLVAACSSGSGDDGDSGPGQSTTSGAGEDTTRAGVDGLLPLGTAWETFKVGEFDGEGAVRAITAVGDAVWVMGTRWNAPVLWRSTDAETWEEIVFPPRNEDSVALRGILGRPDGGYVAFGQRSTDCVEQYRQGEDRYLNYCDRHRPVIYLSDDGRAWTLTEPQAMTPPLDHSAVVVSMATYAEGFIAVGTVQGPDWHGRVWTSPDGEDWTVAAEIRGEDYTSLSQVLTDGDQIVVTAAAHECGVPRDIREGSWIMDTFAKHLRIYQGTAPDTLELQGPDDHPLAPTPLDADCDTVSLEALDRYPWAEGVMVDGVITLVERRAADDSREDETRVRRIARLEGGTWEAEEVELDRLSSERGALVDAGGRLAIVGDNGGTGRPLAAMWAVARGDDGSWEHREAANLVLWTPDARGILDATFFNDAILMSGTRAERHYAPEGITEALVARSAPTSITEWNDCPLEPNARCGSVMLDAFEGAPDFGAIDLSGTDFTTANFGRANLDAASFRGATLIGVDGSQDATFVGTDFTGADLRGAWLYGVARADFTDARLDDARIRFWDTITIEGATLTEARLTQWVQPGAGHLPVELSLARTDLRGAHISGPSNSAQKLVITDLRGATVEGTTFANVDLSRADVTGVPLAELHLDEDSICPNGEAPTGESSRRMTCG